MVVSAIITVLLLLVLVGLLAYAARGGRPARAAEAEPVTGVVAMERKIGLTLAMLFATGGFLTLYGFAFEPWRLAAASESQENISIRRAVETYATLCYSCHGEDGRGAVVPGSEPPRVAPALNRADFRPTDEDEIKSTYQFLFRTIARGRPNTPMPAWSRNEGGALLDEQINELVLMIMNGDTEIAMQHELPQGGVFAPILPNEGESAKVWDHVKEAVHEAIAHGGPTPIPLPEAPAVELPPEAQQGLEVWRGEGGCIGCHTIAGMGGGTSGPELSNIGNVAATRKPGMSAEDYIRESILDPNAFVVEGYQAIMPPFQGRLTEEQLNALVAFYMTLKQ